MLHALGVVGLATVLLAGVSCRRSPAPDSASPAGSATLRDAGVDARAPGLAAANGTTPDGTATSRRDVPPRFNLDTGCARGFARSGDAARDLDRLHKLCSPGLGGDAGASGVPYATLSLRSGASTTFELPARPLCVRVAAVVEAATTIDVRVSDGHERIGAIRSSGGAALVPAAGPICLRSTTGSRLVIEVEAVGPDGSDASEATPSVALDVWQSAEM